MENLKNFLNNDLFSSVFRFNFVLHFTPEQILEMLNANSDKCSPGK